MLSQMRFLGESEIAELLAAAGLPDVDSGTIEEMERIVAEADRTLIQ